MSYQVAIEQEARTIVITGIGVGTTADTLDLIAQLRDTFREHGGFSMIYDSSAMDIASSPADMMKVAEALFQESRIAVSKIAVVVPESRVTLARIFSALAQSHGVSADVFTHLTDARRWLGIS